MKLPDKIIKHRKANGWSQEDFAEKLNISRQAISRWENGTALFGFCFASSTFNAVAQFVLYFKKR